MKNNIFYFIATCLLLSFFISCKDTPEKEMKKIQKMEDDIFKSNAPVQEPAKLQTLMDLYVNYTEKYPEDTMTPELLMRAADIAVNLNQADYAITLYNKIYNQYPDFSKRPEALFMTAFSYENYVGKLDLAKEHYELFIQQYPDHELLETAKICLDNLGKSPEELILEMMQKEASNDSIAQ